MQRDQQKAEGCLDEISERGKGAQIRMLWLFFNCVIPSKSQEWQNWEYTRVPIYYVAEGVVWEE